MDKPYLFEKIFSPDQPTKKLEDIKNVEGEEEFYEKNKLMESEFSDLVDVLRKDKYIKLPVINDLMTLFWRLVGNKISPAAMTSVPTLSFWCEKKNDKSIALILIPQNWHEQLIADPHYQMGALVYVASQSKDYWNNKVGPGLQDEVINRAQSYEAELLFHFQKTDPKFKPNDYQKEVMGKFPNGVYSEKTNYVGREYDGNFPPFPVSM
jgi:hypothetical protein